MNEINFPNSLEAELAVVGSILLDSDSIYKVIDILQPSDFYSIRNSKIYSNILDLFNKGEKVDILTLSQYLNSKGILSEIGGSAYLAQTVQSVPTSSNIIKYSEIIRDKSIRRQLITAQEYNLQTISDESRDIDTVLAETQGRIVSINNLNKIDDSIKSIIRELEKTQDVYSQKYEDGKKIIGISTGFEKLDDCIDGLRPGHIWVVGAFTSTGKTQFALNIVNAVLEQKIPTSIISLEMSRVDLAARLIGIRQNLSSMKILKGKTEIDLWQQIEQHKNFLYNSPLEIHTTYFDLEKIKMLIRKDVYIRKVKFIVIDYVQNILSEKGLREYDLMTQSAVDLQSLARELGITIYIVSQISNEAEKGQGAGAGFKGTGALEAVADMAIRLKRDKKNESETDVCVPIEIIISKNRHGYTGTIRDYFMYLKSGFFSTSPTHK